MASQSSPIDIASSPIPVVNLSDSNDLGQVQQQQQQQQQGQQRNASTTLWSPLNDSEMEGILNEIHASLDAPCTSTQRQTDASPQTPTARPRPDRNTEGNNNGWLSTVGLPRREGDEDDEWFPLTQMDPPPLRPISPLRTGRSLTMIPYGTRRSRNSALVCIQYVFICCCRFFMDDQDIACFRLDAG
jgi:hypothetical protein